MDGKQKRPGLSKKGQGDEEEKKKKKKPKKMPLADLQIFSNPHRTIINPRS
jgi:hypothetical protein